MSEPKFPPPRPLTYSMAETAKVVGRSYTHLRRLYSVGIAPEPKSSVQKGGIRQRRWTKDEVIHLRAWFDKVESGDLMVQKAIDNHKPRRKKAKK